MEKINIKTKGVKIVKDNKNNKVKKNASTNPFGISFKGNVIQADVFEVTKQSGIDNLKDKLATKSKMFASAVVGNINTFNNALKSRVNSVVTFGRQIKQNALNAWDKASNININFGEGFKSTMDSISSKFLGESGLSVKALTKKPVSELASMLRSELNV